MIIYLKRTGVFLCLLFAHTAFSGEKNSLLQQAQQLKLAEDPRWHTLLHYVPDSSDTGFVSEVDAPAFFYAAQGKNDPAAELRATLLHFLKEPDTRCRFPARYRWLAERLKLPALQDCPDLQTWLHEVQAEGLSLIFPAAYLNNPSSMFGHTLLRLDQTGQDERTRLLAQAVNYAAMTGDDNGAVFAWKGIIGSYPGYFSLLPYARKVKEYSDWENRDIWEYQLNFSSTEIHALLEHLWELDKVYFNYYFFDENCSYHLLSLLEAARPGLNLRGGLRPWVIPTDTVRAVLNVPGLFRAAVYRPSRASLLRYHLDALSAEERAALRCLAQQTASTPEDCALSAMEKVRRAVVLEAAYDYLYYQHLRSRTKDKNTPPRLRALLLARSRLDVDIPEHKPAPPVRPEQGHRPLRWGLGAGQDQDGAYALVDLRPAYHHLLDPRPGYEDGAQIDFFSIRGQWHEARRRFRLERLTLLDIVSLSPRDEFFHPWSWLFNTGWQRRATEQRDDALVFHSNGGSGVFSRGASWGAYLFAEGSLDLGASLARGYALGPAVEGGVLWDAAAAWRIRANWQSTRFLFGERDTRHEWSLQSRFSLGRNSALRINWRIQRNRNTSDTRQLELIWHGYF